MRLRPSIVPHPGGWIVVRCIYSRVLALSYELESTRVRVSR
jgi:hypothetical protein